MRDSAMPAIAVSWYMATSIALVFFNKHALSHGLPSPLALTWWQMVVTLPLIVGMRRLRDPLSVGFELRALSRSRCGGGRCSLMWILIHASSCT